MNSEQEPIGKLISQIYRQNQRLLSRELMPYGIGSGGQYGFLKLILNNPGITQDQMTHEMKFDKATTARSVKNLEEAGYIERRIDPKDRRSSLIYPTAKAIEFAPALKMILADINTTIVSGLTTEEVEHLFSLLHKISKNTAEL